MEEIRWKTLNAGGRRRVVVTRALPGGRWLEILAAAGCAVDVNEASRGLTVAEIQAAVGRRCDGVIGQIVEPWGEELFRALQAAGGRVYSNYAVGFNNVDLDAATRCGIAVGNTPGVLTETTAELAVALSFAAARRVPESERFLRAGRWSAVGWQPKLFLGELLFRKTLGLVGAGRIGCTYARMMAEGHKMNIVYHDVRRSEALERFAERYNAFLEAEGAPPIRCRRASSLEELLQEADLVSLHTLLDASTRHLINAERLARMKPTAVLVNTSRGPVIDEAALVEHCRRNPGFRAGLDVFEREPELAPGLCELENVVLVPHIGSATLYAREGMATLAAANAAGILMGWPVWNRPEIDAFLGPEAPRAAPSIVNAEALGLTRF